MYQLRLRAKKQYHHPPSSKTNSSTKRRSITKQRRRYKILLLPLYLHIWDQTQSKVPRYQLWQGKRDPWHALVETNLLNQVRDQKLGSHTPSNSIHSPTFPDLLPQEHSPREPFFPDEAFINYTRIESQTPRLSRFIKANGRIVPVTIAQASIQTSPSLPEAYKEYEVVFSEEAERKMPPKRACDLSIDLDESFVPKVSSTSGRMKNGGRLRRRTP